VSARNDRAMDWLAGKNNSWSPRIAVVKTFFEGRGHYNSKMGPDYGLLSKLAHPTVAAAGNTAMLCGVRRGIPQANAELAPAKKNNQERVRSALYRLAWLVLDQDAQFIQIPVAPKSMPLSEHFLATYDHIEPGT